MSIFLIALLAVFFVNAIRIVTVMGARNAIYVACWSEDRRALPRSADVSALPSIEGMVWSPRYWHLWTEAQWRAWLVVKTSPPAPPDDRDGG